MSHQIIINDPNELWQPEFSDILKVLEFGIKKHGHANWLENDGRKSSFKEMHDSMFHHLAESYSLGYGTFGHEGDHFFERADSETGLDPLLHLACRALMTYTRIRRGITHTND